ncbi:PREDICTED: fibronectin-like isoform X2 [Priapulus caudatus]|uniref:Fibronectin-like isoform X2 n=1 Tax=Priapulus caudatus TaxID=37621 RepID=A0ABM1F9X1_PRICU|nr:PREDICTED: fibronectin-like isoform X2 [Priapulus caudatus]
MSLHSCENSPHTLPDVQNPLLKPPTNVRAVYNSEDMIVIHWEPPDTSIPVIKYTVSCHVARDADLSVQLQRVTGLSNSASFSGLQPMTSYSIGVSAQYDNTEFRKAGVMTASTRLNVSDDVGTRNAQGGA